MSALLPAVHFAAGAIPFRRVNGTVEVLLITSRRRKRWVIPKGRIPSRRSAREAACREVLEEAGVSGRLSEAPIGLYFRRRGRRLVSVLVFTLEVDQHFEDWPERKERERAWLPVLDAAREIEDDDLRSLVLQLS